MVSISTSVGLAPAASESVPLAKRLRHAERRRKAIAFALVLPLFGFLLSSFVIPIVAMLVSSVYSPTLITVMPRLTQAVEAWDGDGDPPDTVVRALVVDSVMASRRRIIGRVARRLNYHIAGYRSLLYETGEELSRMAQREGLEQLLLDPDIRERLQAIDPRWEDRDYWIAIKHAAPRFTLIYLLRTLDREYDAKGRIVAVGRHRAIFVRVLGITVQICATVTLLTLLMGFSIAFLLAQLPTRLSNYLILLLLLPLYISLLVKSTAWMVVLQNQGLINDLGIGLGLWKQPVELIRNRISTHIAMVHALLPYMTFPLFAVMKNIDGYHMKAAATLGATPLQAFLRVYLPQTVPGIGAGVLLTFILALGLYVPVSLVGGPADQMLSYYIVQFGNYGGLGAALSLQLLALVAIFLFVYRQLFGIGQLRSAWR